MNVLALGVPNSVVIGTFYLQIVFLAYDTFINIASDILKNWIYKCNEILSYQAVCHMYRKYVHIVQLYYACCFLNFSYSLVGLQGAAEKSRHQNFFAVFSATVWDFNMKFYSFIY